MDVNGVGWVAAIIVGGLAGWLAEMVMKSNMGIFMNILLGIVGAIVLNAILAALNIQGFGIGWVAYLITGFIGACILIFVGRLVRR
ncbi:GlsB/YeaQ/YmgE family stress response membrane protein [Mesorhizobium sp. SP-1A]|uniref:GlsB/YeaQ/YmgE family stress response membrane protein n=1 Tax=Mesorhizobium sp. SP-1A TaxID=3077840 RepID=UPI0028F6D63F|nr:GlsB/YeaQ/YmgE family stress response membrane protein [Mesorhizobium sp. SP-1A]